MDYNEIEGFSQYTDQGILLEKLLQDLPTDINVLEIGIYYGRMTIMWNDILQKNNINYSYTAIDNFKGIETNKGQDIDFKGIALKNLKPLLNNINIIDNDSKKEYINHPDNFYDIVYIDGEHTYEGVLNDIKCWLPKVKEGGYICGDDYIAGWPGVVQAVNEMFGNKVNIIGGQQWYVKI